MFNCRWKRAVLTKVRRNISILQIAWKSFNDDRYRHIEAKQLNLNFFPSRAVYVVVLGKYAGRGLVKKVLVPFLLGLKFKTTVLLPLAFALIALKAWKALTLGLISLVVSTAVVVFKLAKPKVRVEQKKGSLEKKLATETF